MTAAPPQPLPSADESSRNKVIAQAAEFSRSKSGAHVYLVDADESGPELAALSRSAELDHVFVIALAHSIHGRAAGAAAAKRNPAHFCVHSAMLGVDKRIMDATIAVFAVLLAQKLSSSAAIILIGGDVAFGHALVTMLPGHRTAIATTASAMWGDSAPHTTADSGDDEADDAGGRPPVDSVVPPLVPAPAPASKGARAGHARAPLSPDAKRELVAYYRQHWDGSDSDFCRTHSIDLGNFSKYVRGLKSSPTSEAAMMHWREEHGRK